MRTHTHTHTEASSPKRSQGPAVGARGQRQGVCTQCGDGRGWSPVSHPHCGLGRVTGPLTAYTGQSLPPPTLGLPASRQTGPHPGDRKKVPTPESGPLQITEGGETLGSGGSSGFTSASPQLTLQPCCLLARSTASLNLNFLICKMGMVRPMIMNVCAVGVYTLWPGSPTLQVWV